MLNRRGTTLVELLVTTIVGGIALALVAAICVRQQRIVADLGHATSLSAQLREASTILPIDLASVASGAGDIRTALDTALEIRATMASAVVCDTSRGAVMLSPSPAYAGFLAPIAAGDTVWRLLNDSLETWQPSGIVSVASAPAGPCHALAPLLDAQSASAPRVLLTLDSVATAAWIGVPVRVTRPIRYSLYRSADGWALGAREWNTTTLRFNTIQPISGPFLSASAGGIRFLYVDSTGSLLPSPVPDPRAIALIRIDLRGQTSRVVRAVAAAGPLAPRIDSTTTMVLLRNRR